MGKIFPQKRNNMEEKKMRLIKTFSVSGILVLTAIIVLVIYVAQKFTFYSKWVNHTKTVLIANNELSRELLLAERNQRIYAITGNLENLELYKSQKNESFKKVYAIKEMVKDNAIQTNNVNILINMIKDRVLYMDSTIVLIENGNDTFRILKNRISASISLKSMLQISKHIDKMNEYENELLEIRLTNWNRYMELLYPFIFLLFLLSFIIGFLNFYSLRNFNKAREKHTKEIENYQHELRKKITDLNNSNNDLEQFAYIASHDLQEPLRKVIAFGDLLQESAANSLNDESKMYLNKMTSAANRMRQLITDLLNYSRAGRKDVKIEWIDTNKIISEIEDDFALIIKETNAEINTEKLPKIFADYTTLKQVFQNIISNAIKFRNPNVHPQISISAKSATFDLINKYSDLNSLKKYNLFVIADNGIGFEKEFSEKIFFIFQRLHNKQQFEGTGIGLAVCKKIIESIGGKIWAESEKDKGTSFYILVPEE